MNVVEIEVDAPCCENLHFLPLDRRIRGRFGYQRLAQHSARAYDHYSDMPQEVPGQVLGVDVGKGVVYVREPLRDREHEDLRARFEHKGFAIPQEREEFAADADVMATWLFWMRRATEGGLAKLVAGEFQKKPPGVAKVDYFYRDRRQDPRDDAIAKLIDVVAGLLPAAKRQELLAGLAEAKS